MMRRMGFAALVMAAGMVLAVLLLITVGWKLALLVAAVAGAAAIVLGVRAVMKFSDDPFGDEHFTGGRK